MAFDKRVQHDEYENTYTFIGNGPKKILLMKEISSLKQPKEKLESFKLEELSNTPITKQVEVTSKEEEIINIESRI